MPRALRIVVPCFPHHVTQRGNYKQKVFYTQKDYMLYLEWLSEYTNKYELSIVAYCLMPNHVHFIAIPTYEDSLANTFSVCHSRYASYLHKKKNLKGHLWQGRFFSTVLDDIHLYAAVKYVELNPVKAGLVKCAWDWPWSSAAIHIKKENPILALNKVYDILDIPDWKSYLHEKDDTAIVSVLEANTRSGKPCGETTFFKKLEKLLGKTLMTSYGRKKDHVVPRYVGL